MSDRIGRAFNRSGATKAVAHDISKAFDRVWHAGVLHKLRFYEISCQIFGLISPFLSNRQLWVVLDGKSLHEYPVNDGFLKGLFLILHFSYYTLMIFVMMLSVILLSVLMLLPSTLNVIRYISDLWQQLELASELESDLQDTVDWGKKWLVDFNGGKTQLALFDQSNNIGAIDV